MQLVHSRAHVQLLFDGRLEDKLPVEEDSDKIANDSVSHLHWARNLLVRAQDRAPHSSGHPNRKCRNASETKERNLRLTHNSLSTHGWPLHWINPAFRNLALTLSFGCLFFDARALHDEFPLRPLRPLLHVLHGQVQGQGSEEDKVSWVGSWSEREEDVSREAVSQETRINNFSI